MSNDAKARVQELEELVNKLTFENENLREENCRLNLRNDSLETMVNNLRIKLLNSQTTIKNQELSLSAISNVNGKVNGIASPQHQHNRRKSCGELSDQSENHGSPKDMLLLKGGVADDQSDSSPNMKAQRSPSLPEKPLFTPLKVKTVKLPNNDEMLKMLVEFERDLLSEAPTIFAAFKKFLQAIKKDELNGANIYDMIERYATALDEIPRFKQKWNIEKNQNLVNLLEAFLFECLYPKVFAMDEDHKAKNEMAQEKLYVLQNLITMDLLEIPPKHQIQSLIQYCQNELRKINSVRSPLNKLIIVEHVHQSIINAITSGDGALPNADEIFPIFVYIVLQANPDNFPMNLEYIQKFVRKKMLMGEYGYVLANLTAAVNFLECVDGKALMKGELKTLRKKSGFH